MATTRSQDLKVLETLFGARDDGVQACETRLVPLGYFDKGERLSSSPCSLKLDAAITLARHALKILTTPQWRDIKEKDIGSALAKLLDAQSLAEQEGLEVLASQAKVWATGLRNIRDTK